MRSGNSVTLDFSGPFMSLFLTGRVRLQGQSEGTKLCRYEIAENVAKGRGTGRLSALLGKMGSNPSQSQKLKMLDLPTFPL